MGLSALIRQTLILALAALAVCAGMICASGCHTAAGDGPAYPEYVSLTDAPSDALLRLSAESGAYADEFELTVECGDPEAVVFYTTDGSDPRTSGTRELYRGSISVKHRQGDKNVASAVHPSLFDAANCYLNEAGDGYICVTEPPGDDDVDKCAVIRTAALDSAGAYTNVVTGTYFTGSMEDHIEGLAESCAAAGMPLAVVSVSMEHSDLFDYEKGIYVKGACFDDHIRAMLREYGRLDSNARNLEANYTQRGRAWERPAHVDIFECAPEESRLVLSQDCGIRIHGDHSRSDLQKGFRLYARREYGDNNFDYPFFDRALDESGRVIDQFKTLVLRNGGSCAFTTKYNDAFWQSLVSGTAAETQASRPCVVYLNGEYWGVYVLQQDYTDDHFEDTYGVEKETVVLYKGGGRTGSLGYRLDVGELPEGQTREEYYFDELLEFFEEHEDLRSDEDYAAFCEIVDPESARDYYAVQLWIDNKWDWPEKNWSMWRTVVTDPENPFADGRWRFCLYDLEFGGVNGINDAGANTMASSNYMEYGLLDRRTDNPSVLVFAYLMSNDGFREEFGRTVLAMSENEFEYDHALEALDRFQAVYSPLMEQFFRRCNHSGNTGAGGESFGSYHCVREFLSERAEHIRPMLDWAERFFADS